MKKYKCSTIVPKVFYNYEFTGINLDIGAGKYMKATSILASKNVYNLRYDPHLLPTTHNQEILIEIETTKLDSITVNNVLNVIEFEERIKIYEWVSRLQKRDGSKVYFQIYEGNKSGIKDDKQNNQTSEYYKEEMKEYIKTIREDNILVSDSPNLIKDGSVHY